MSLYKSLTYTALILAFFFIFPKTIFAQGVTKNCPIQIVPPVQSTTRAADFVVDVGTNNEPGVTGWVMQFQCGFTLGVGPLQTTPIQQAQIDGFPQIGSNSLIQGRLDKNGTGSNIQPCEFNPAGNPQKINVFRVIGGRREPQPYCIASYEVSDVDIQCRLELQDRTRPGLTGIITPDMKIITIASQLNVNGYDLTPNERFVLLWDNQPIQTSFLGAPAFVNTPGFQMQIPADRMIPGPHTIAVRKWEPGNSTGSTLLSLTTPWGTILSGGRNFTDFLASFGPPLCSIKYNVGTQSEPGSIISTSTGVINKIAKCDPAKGDICTNAASDACDPATGKLISTGTGLMTAIGCVPTRPGDFVNALLRLAAAIGGGLAILLMFFGAFSMITSAGNPEAVKKGQDQITAAAIGLVFILLAVLLLQIIGVNILNIPGFR